MKDFILILTRLLRALPLFLFCFAAHAQAQQVLSVCGAIEVNDQSLIETFVFPEARSEKCKKWKSRNGTPFTAPIEFQNIKIDTDEELVFDRRKSNVPNFLPSFVMFDKKNNKYSFDWKKFEDAYNDWPMYQRSAETMHADGHSRKTKVNFITRKTGGDNFVACEILYVNNKDNSIEWRETFYSFDAANRLSVWYWSPLMSAKRPDDFKFLAGMNKLFLAMRSLQVGK